MKNGGRSLPPFFYAFLPWASGQRSQKICKFLCEIDRLSACRLVVFDIKSLLNLLDTFNQLKAFGLRWLADVGFGADGL